jgi:hypothetical protein
MHVKNSTFFVQDRCLGSGSGSGSGSGNFRERGSRSQESNINQYPEPKRCPRQEILCVQGCIINQRYEPFVPSSKTFKSRYK